MATDSPGTSNDFMTFATKLSKPTRGAAAVVRVSDCAPADSTKSSAIASAPSIAYGRSRIMSVAGFWVM